jgi:H/ACA ribonucleoprotein complex subunit 2
MSDAEAAQADRPTKRVRTAYVQGPISAIAQPMAGKKLHKRIYKIVKKAADAKALKRGVKEVVKAVRKGDSGLVVIAGDIRCGAWRLCLNWR